MATHDLDTVHHDVRCSVERLEAIFSRFRETSELSYVNAHPGEWVSVSEELSAVLVLAEEAFHRTRGVFNPCLGHVMEAIGYGPSFEFIHSQGEHHPEGTLSHHVHRPTLTISDKLSYRLSDNRDAVYVSPGTKIDLGGIAKGWIVEQVAKRIRGKGIQDYILSAGGDMVCSGKNNGEAWRVGIEDPHHPGQNVLTLNVAQSAVATSGSYRRQWVQHAAPVHHLIDPRNGKSAASDVLSCTVVAQHLVAAEVYAKTGLILGAEAGIRWLSTQNHRGWVMVLNDGEVVHAWNS